MPRVQEVYYTKIWCIKLFIQVSLLIQLLIACKHLSNLDQHRQRPEFRIFLKELKTRKKLHPTSGRFTIPQLAKENFASFGNLHLAPCRYTSQEIRMTL